MFKARTSSPFAQGTSEMPWILWSSAVPVDDLADERNTDNRSVIDEMEDIDPERIQTNGRNLTQSLPHSQYNAVIGRMQKAGKQTGTFSEWKT